MSYKTLEVELENGRVHTAGPEPLPAHAHALLTILTPAAPDTTNGLLAGRVGVVQTCAELADRWDGLPKLPPDEAGAFADDLEKARTNLPPLKSSWD
jgi:hypothetical protein